MFASPLQIDRKWILYCSGGEVFKGEKYHKALSQVWLNTVTVLTEDNRIRLNKERKMGVFKELHSK